MLCASLHYIVLYIDHNKIFTYEGLGFLSVHFASSQECHLRRFALLDPNLDPILGQECSHTQIQATLASTLHPLDSLGHVGPLLMDNTTTMDITLPHLAHLECSQEDLDASSHCHHQVANLLEVIMGITKSTSITSMAMAIMATAIMARSMVPAPAAAQIQTEDILFCSHAQLSSTLQPFRLPLGLS